MLPGIKFQIPTLLSRDFFVDREDSSEYIVGRELRARAKTIYTSRRPLNLLELLIFTVLFRGILYSEFRY